MARIIIDPEVCKGCGICVSVCPIKILKISNIVTNKAGYFVAEVVEDKCIGCCSCAIMCPDSAISVFKQ